jgi:hypothetical protein
MKKPLELPPELWSIIARDLKREPPPRRARANWNDDFNQQDLVTLQRVSKVSHLLARLVWGDYC